MANTYPIYFIEEIMKKEKFSYSKILLLTKKKEIRQAMVFCNKGTTIIEVIASLGISVLITMMLVNIYVTSMKNYNDSQKYNRETIDMYEGLMYIDYYVNYNGEEYYIEDSKLYVEGKDGIEKNYIFLKDNEIRVAYKNNSGNGYTSQPLLYGVSEFNLAENENVIFIEIVTISGNKVKKAIGRI